MDNLSELQYLAIALIFVWGGFARSSLGFGGAALTIPLLLLIVDNPLIFLPIIAVHMILFGGIILWENRQLVNWRYMGQSFYFLIPAKLAGVIGLLNLSPNILAAMIYCFTCIYAFSYLLNKPFVSRNSWTDRSLLLLGGYASGTALIAAPVVVSVYANNLRKEELRQTLFALWIILCTIKLSAFMIVDVDMQWRHQLWLLPVATLGHILGLIAHRRLMQVDQVQFLRIIGLILLFVCAIGIYGTL